MNETKPPQLAAFFFGRKRDRAWLMTAVVQWHIPDKRLSVACPVPAKADDKRGKGRTVRRASGLGRHGEARRCRFRKLYPFDSQSRTNQNMIAV
jgi:hypothetical protein